MANPLTATSAISRTDARGFTLLELLIAISLVIAIGALAMPYTFRAFERREFDAAIDRFSMQLHMARALARSEGVPLVLRIDESGHRLEVLAINPRDGFELGSGEEEIVASWRRIVLPETIWLAPLGGEEEEGIVWAEPTRLGMFMPDGHVMGFSPVLLVCESDRYRLEVDPWTGRVTSTSLSGKVAG